MPLAPSAALLRRVCLCLLAAAYLWLALNWSYSTGERAGWVQKFSNKGWICKTWEGELALVSLPAVFVLADAFGRAVDRVASLATSSTRAMAVFVLVLFAIPLALIALL